MTGISSVHVWSVGVTNVKEWFAPWERLKKKLLYLSESRLDCDLNWPPNYGWGETYYDGTIYYLHVGILTVALYD